MEQVFYSKNHFKGCFPSVMGVSLIFLVFFAMKDSGSRFKSWNI